VNLYLQQAGVGSTTVEQAGTQTITQNEFALTCRTPGSHPPS